MDDGVIFAAVIAAAGSVVSSLFNAYMVYKSQYKPAIERIKHEKESAEYNKLSDIKNKNSKYRDPLINAAYDLQCRIYKIYHHDIILKSVINNDKREVDYLRYNTVYTICQFFAWREIIRVEIGYLYNNDDLTRLQISTRLDDIYSVWQKEEFGPKLRVFSGEQRAIGEKMSRGTNEGLKCIGYAEFRDIADSGAIPFISDMIADVVTISKADTSCINRLVCMHNHLVELLCLLDQSSKRIDITKLSKLESVPS